ncbi:MAG TPA: hypothetical protein VGM68_12195 [Rhizomicrobium sp.]|jgi:hypothetical protein
MASDNLAAPAPLRYTDGRNRRSRWRLVLPFAVCAAALFLLLNGQLRRSGDIEVRACLEPVYSGLFGGGVGAMERCLANRAQLFGESNARWLRYVRHLEASCPISVGMQGQAICEFNVKAKEDRAGKGWRTKDY